MAKYLVTGGAGFIGSHLTNALLSQGDEVIILDNLTSGKLENIPKEAHFIEGDILDQELLQNTVKDIDGCFHLAAILSMEETMRHWPETHAVNTAGTINVLKTICQNQSSRRIPIVYASSCAVYGDCKTLPLSESTKISPISVYGADKLCSEIHTYVAHHLFSNPIICFRIFNVYGARQDPNSPYSGVISRFMHRMLHNEPIEIYGDGNQTRDFVYVKDVIQFFLRAIKLKHNQHHICNLATGQSVTINNLARILGEIIKKSPNIQYQSKREGDVYHSIGDPTLSYQLLQYQTQYRLQQGLLDYYHEI